MQIRQIPTEDRCEEGLKAFTEGAIRDILAEEDILMNCESFLSQIVPNSQVPTNELLPTIGLFFSVYGTLPESIRNNEDLSAVIQLIDSTIFAIMFLPR